MKYEAATQEQENKNQKNIVDSKIDSDILTNNNTTPLSVISVTQLKQATPQSTQQITQITRNTLESKRSTGNSNSSNKDIISIVSGQVTIICAGGAGFPGVKSLW